MKNLVALVTGTSSGFGKLTAALLARSGFRVFGTSRKAQETTPELEMIELDVTSTASVRSCVQYVLAQAERIDLLVNNAGLTHASLIEETRTDMADCVFETNFWGVVRMVQTVLPAMRHQQSGRIINVGSLAGLMGAPGQGFYSASKHALEGYSETLRVEVEQFNIYVSLIEPGFFRTGLHNSMLRSADRIDNYDTICLGIESAVSGAIAQGDDPRKVAKLITRVAIAKKPKLRYRVGADARWLPRLKMLLPEAWFLAGMRRRFGLSRPRERKHPGA